MPVRAMGEYSATRHLEWVCTCLDSEHLLFRFVAAALPELVVRVCSPGALLAIQCQCSCCQASYRVRDQAEVL